MAHDDFTVRAEIQQRRQFAAFVQADGKNARKNVRTDKTAEAGKKFHDGRRRQIPAEFAR